MDAPCIRRRDARAERLADADGAGMALLMLSRRKLADHTADPSLHLQRPTALGGQRYDTSDTAGFFPLTPALRHSRIAPERGGHDGGATWMRASTKTRGCTGAMDTTPSLTLTSPPEKSWSTAAMAASSTSTKPQTILTERPPTGKTNRKRRNRASENGDEVLEQGRLIGTRDLQLHGFPLSQPRDTGSVKFSSAEPID